MRKRNIGRIFLIPNRMEKRMGDPLRMLSNTDEKRAIWVKHVS
jgi:hypothetical protein